MHDELPIYAERRKLTARLMRRAGIAGREVEPEYAGGWTSLSRHQRPSERSAPFPFCTSARQLPSASSDCTDAHVGLEALFEGSEVVHGRVSELAFDNDTANDWVYDLVDARDLTLVGRIFMSLRLFHPEGHASPDAACHETRDATSIRGGHPPGATSLSSEARSHRFDTWRRTAV